MYCFYDDFLEAIFESLVEFKADALEYAKLHDLRIDEHKNDMILKGEIFCVFIGFINVLFCQVEYRIYNKSRVV